MKTNKVKQRHIDKQHRLLNKQLKLRKKKLKLVVKRVRLLMILLYSLVKKFKNKLIVQKEILIGQKKKKPKINGKLKLMN